MDDTLGMHVENAFHDLVGEVLDVTSVQLLSIVSDDIHEVLRAVLKHQVHGLKLLGVAWSHNSLELHNLY